MTKKNIKLAILFADIANSTSLYETLGDKAALRVVENCLDLLSRVTVKHGGTVVKTIGDEIMCTFQSIDQAVEAAMDMNRGLMDIPMLPRPDMFPPNIYVGIQWGPVIKEDDDVFGDAVNVASRMSGIAKPRQIVTTEDAVGVMQPQHQNMTRLFDKTTIKGKSGKVKIYEIIWEQKDETIMLDGPLDTLTIDADLELEYMGQIIRVGPERPEVTLGRQNHNDLVINDIRVSRTHARIEYRKGKFVLIDQSTNGTYARASEGEDIKLKHDESLLNGNGIISLGREIDFEDPETLPLIKYRITL